MKQEDWLLVVELFILISQGRGIQLLYHLATNSYIINEYHQMDGKQIAFLCFVLIIIYVFRLPFLFLFIFGSFCEYDVLTDILLLLFQSHTIIQCVQCTELAIGSS